MPVALLPLHERRLAAMTLTALGVSESAKTAMLSRTHAPIGKGGTNWITKLKPGNTGQLPAYIQNIRNAIMRDGAPESQATAIAIGRCKDWAEGKGGVSPEVKAAAAKAIAEWEADKAKSNTKVKEARMGDVLEMKLSADRIGDLSVLEADAKKVFCLKCKKKVTPTDDSKCPTDGTDLSKAMKISEAALTAAGRKNLPKSAFAIPENAPGPGSYPIQDKAHAIDALSRAKGTPEESRVKAAVYKAFPALKPDSSS